MDLKNKLSNEILKENIILISHPNVRFGKDGNQYFYILGNLPEHDCIVGFGDTPLDALNRFCKMYKTGEDR